MSWKAEVLASGETTWATNGLCFASKEEAEKYARDLFSRWTAVKEFRVTEFSNEQVNYTFKDGMLKATKKESASVVEFVNKMLNEDDAKAQISYNGGGKYVVKVSADIAKQLQGQYPKSFTDGHAGPGNTVTFYATERGSKIAKDWLSIKGIKVVGSAMWDLAPGEMPSW